MTIRREEVSKEPPQVPPPMTLLDALKDPESFVSKMVESVTYCQFVAVGPMTLRTLLMDFDGADKLCLEPMIYKGKPGTMVTTDDDEVYVRFCDRFAEPCDHK